MTFHAVRFPLDNCFGGARGGPERATRYSYAGVRPRGANSRWLHSRRRYNAGYGVKSRADMAAVLAFSRSGAGDFTQFLWRDGLDYSSERDGYAGDARPDGRNR